MIVVDYLQLVRCNRKFNNRASEVGEVSKQFKALARELHVPIILLSQLNRVSEMNVTKEPTMSELRESGDIEQDASNIILMWNLDEDRKFKGLKVERIDRVHRLEKLFSLKVIVWNLSSEPKPLNRFKHGCDRKTVSEKYVAAHH